MTGRGPLRRMWALAAPPPGRITVATALATMSLASGVGLLAVSAWLISRASEQPPILYLQVAIVCVRAFGISRGVLRYAERLVGHEAALRSLTRIRMGVYERLERLSPAGLGSYRRGDLLARLVGDVDTSVDLIVRVVIPAVSGLLAGGLAAAVGASILPTAGIALLAMVVVVGLVSPWLAGQVGAQAELTRADADGRLTTQVVSSLTAAPELLAFGATEASMQEIARADARLTAIDRRAATAAGAGSALSVLTTGLTIVACLLLGVAAMESGQLSGVWLATLVLMPLAIADVLSGMPAAALARARVSGAARRVFDVMDAPDPVPDTAGDRSRGEPPPRWAHPDLAVGAMSARYPRSGTDAVTGIDLNLADGARVALVGPSGSGKSTVAAVLLRLLDFSEGTYRLGGLDVRAVGEEHVRQAVTAVGQQAHLFDTTIEENLRLANRSADDAAIRDAVERVQLDDWVDGLPAGLATRVGVHGSAVSGGQAQRIALARALLADCPIVVLDEPGEHLDPLMADAVTAAALDTTTGRSVVLVTHRMAHTGRCDEVLVLDGGHVVSRGTPDELRATGGWYAEARTREEGSDMAIGGPDHG